MSIVRVKNNKAEADVWCGQTIAPSEYFQIPESYIERWREDTKVFQDIANANLIVNNVDEDITNPIEGYEYLEHSLPENVKTTREQVVDWGTLKSFVTNNKGTYMNYVDMSTYYYIWLLFKDQTLYIPKLEKNTADATDFETNYKSSCNKAQPVESRLRTCRYGRKQHCRYISFTTASQGTFDNTNYLDESYGDVTYTMVDVDRAVTTNNAAAKETWIDWMPEFSYEIRGGAIYIPETLTGNLDLWEAHVVAAPSIPKQYGGCIEFLANPRLKWSRGSRIECNAQLDPADVEYVEGMDANKIRFIFKHPVGEQVEFQIHLELYLDN